MCFSLNRKFWTKNVCKKVEEINPDYKFYINYSFFCRVAEMGKLCYIKDYFTNFIMQIQNLTINHIGYKEHKEIMRRYIPKDLNKWNLRYKKVFCIARRFYKYVMQGDIDYILKGFIRRIMNYGGKK